MSYQEYSEIPAFEFAVWSGEGNQLNVQDPAPGNLLWSRKDGKAPPAIGERIDIRMNNCGPAIVTGYFSEDKWLGVRCTLLEAPEWHRKQNDGVATNGHVFGPEFEPLASSGEFDLGDNLAFRWMIQGDSRPEIYGWLERNHSIVKGSGGFWRTVNPREALKRVKAAFPAELEQLAI